MRVTIDTNVLVHAVTCDEPQQARLAADLLRDAELGADEFATFDRRAAHLTSTNGLPVHLLESTPS